MKRIVAIVAMLFAFAVISTESAEAEHMAVGRIYVSPIAGDGSEANPYTAEVCTYQHVARCRNAIASQPSGEDKGHPLYDWSLTYVETRNPMDGGEPDWSGFDDAGPWVVRIGESLTDTVPQSTKTRVRQAGALTKEELDTVTDFYSLLDKLLKKHNGPLATVEVQFPEFFAGH